MLSAAAFAVSVRREGNKDASSFLRPIIDCCSLSLLNSRVDAGLAAAERGPTGKAKAGLFTVNGVMHDPVDT